MNKECLFERLGYNPSFVADFLINEESSKIQKPKNEIDACVRKEHLDEAEKLLLQLYRDERFVKQKFSKQYY